MCPDTLRPTQMTQYGVPLGRGYNCQIGIMKQRSEKIYDFCEKMKLSSQQTSPRVLSNSLALFTQNSNLTAGGYPDILGCPTVVLFSFYARRTNSRGWKGKSILSKNRRWNIIISTFWYYVPFGTFSCTKRYIPFGTLGTKR